MWRELCLAGRWHGMWEGSTRGWADGGGQASQVMAGGPAWRLGGRQLGLRGGCEGAGRRRCYSAVAHCSSSRDPALFLTAQVALWVKNPPAMWETQETALITGSGRSPGGGQGNALQYSCLENLVDRGAWRAGVHRVAKSQT